MTEIWLFENELLKDKIKKIKNLCVEALGEPGNIDRNLLRSIISICELMDSKKENNENLQPMQK